MAAPPGENIPNMNVAATHATLTTSFPQMELNLNNPGPSGITLTPQRATLFSPLPSTSTEQFQKRRSSSRSIKRKKFDDELVESSLVKTSRPRPPSTTFPVMPALTYPLVVPPSHIVSTVGSNEQIVVEALAAPPPPEKKKPRPTPKRVKKMKTVPPYVTKDIGRWKPSDDLMLIYAARQSCKLSSVFTGVKFSCRFTLQEIQERWYTLLYDGTISKVAMNAMRQLHPDVIAQIQANAMFSVAEQQLLSTIPSTAHVTLELFQELLDKNTDVFYPMRTAKSLWSHWSIMRNFTLLPDQSIEKINADKIVGVFSDVKELENCELHPVENDENLSAVMQSADRGLKKHIRVLENELPKWQVLVNSITGVSTADFDYQTLAVLKGRFVRYLMRSKEISIGRNTKDHSVDIDLSLEGPSCKVSRKQGVIKLENNGDFTIYSEGKRPFYVDGKAVNNGSKCKLNNNSVLEIISLRFVFMVNQDVINTARGKSNC